MSGTYHPVRTERLYQVLMGLAGLPEDPEVPPLATPQSDPRLQGAMTMMSPTSDATDSSLLQATRTLYIILWFLCVLFNFHTKVHYQYINSLSSFVTVCVWVCVSIIPVFIYY